jgi:hypothetical protein
MTLAVHASAVRPRSSMLSATTPTWRTNIRRIHLKIFRFIRSGAAAHLFALVATLATGSAMAEEAAGDWSGLLAGQLHIIVHVSKDAGGHYGATMESPDQGKVVLAADQVAADADHLSFTIQKISGSFAGTWDAGKDAWVGTWTQGRTLPLVLARMTNRAAALAPPRRPQEEAIAAGPRPYREEAVTFAGGAAGIRLAGNLSIPQGAGPFPAVVLIAGSGPSTRDEEAMGHKIFLVLADTLNRRGIAVLRYDKRGVGQSTGDFATASFTDYVADAEAALGFLKSRPEIAAGRVGLVGHSEGGIVAPLIGARDPSPRFVVLMAAPGMPLDQLGRLQNATISKASGIPDADIAKRLAVLDKIYVDLAAVHDDEQARAIVKADVAQAVADKVSFLLPPDMAVANFTSPRTRQLMRYNPVPALRLLKMPVLALTGSLDVQVPPEPNLGPMRAALQGNPRATVVELPGLNHLFQTAQRGAMEEYGAIEETIAPAALKLIGDWVVAQSL